MPVPLPHLLRLATRPAEPADADLLDAFTRRRDEAAFAELVRRHGPVVYRVCRRVVGRAAADDAFQATFLVLATRAAAARRSGSVAGWLVGVAGRVARQLRRAEYRRARREAASALRERAEPPPDGDQLRVLDEELTRLPARLRAPVVLCHLQGRTQEQATAALGQSARTVRRRLAEACRLLRVRLERRGVVPAVAAGLAADAGPAGAVPADLAGRTIAVALDYLTGGGDPSAPPVALANGVATTMLTRKVAAVMVAAAVGLTALGVNLAGGQNPPAAEAYRGTFRPTQPGSDPLARPKADPAPTAGPLEYKFVATNGSRGPFEKAVVEQGAAGWDYAGSERMQDEKDGSTVVLLVFRKRAAAPVVLNRPAAEAPAAHTEVFKLTNAKADEAAKVLAEMFRGTDVVVAAELTSNSLLVSAPAGKMPDIRRTIGLVDQPPAAAGPQPVVVTLTLERSSARDVADIVGRLFPERTGVRVSADPRTNTLVVAGPPAALAEIEAICRRLEAGRPAGGPPANRP